VCGLTQQAGFSTTRWPKQRDELTLADGQVDIVQRFNTFFALPIAFTHIFQRHQFRAECFVLIDCHHCSYSMRYLSSANW
jgi:hypothetical protein